MTADAPDLRGRLFGGRYRIVRMLGRGGMGAVYEALQEDLHRPVALKLMHPQVARDPYLVDRFRTEAQAAAAIGHPNITQVFDFCATPPEPPFIVMELLAGRSFRELISQNVQLDPRRAAFIGAQILSALGAAHERGVIHRDIKPANVFICTGSAIADLVKVLDFGVAKLARPDGGAQTTVGAVLGTIDYMSPEQARGEVVDARADIYSVGVTLYHALSGRRPFSGTSVAEIVSAILFEPPPPLQSLRPDLPPQLVRVVDRALEKDKARRFSSADEMQRALMEVSGSQHAMRAFTGMTTGPAHPTVQTRQDLGPPSMPTSPTHHVAPPVAVGFAAPPMLPPPPPRASVAFIAAMSATLVIAALVGASAVVYVLHGRSASTARPTTPILGSPSLPGSTGDLQLMPFATVGNIDDDDVEDVVYQAHELGTTFLRLVAFNGKTMTPIWASEPSAGAALALAIVGDTVVVGNTGDHQALRTVDKKTGKARAGEVAMSHNVTLLYASPTSPRIACVDDLYDMRQFDTTTMSALAPAPPDVCPLHRGKASLLPPGYFPHSNVLVDGSHVIAVTENMSAHTFELTSVDPATRKLRWSRHVEGDARAFPNLTLAFGKAYVASSFDKRMGLSTFDAETGAPLTALTEPYRLLAVSPTRVYVSLGDPPTPTMLVLDAKTGAKLPAPSNVVPFPK
jgi:serine/threonine protein kinase